MPDILKLEDFQLVQLDVRWHDAEDFGGEESVPSDAGFGISYDVLRQKEDSRRFALKMRFQSSPDGRGKVGYTIVAVMEGFFSFPESVAEDDMQMLVRINGLTILYGILRGQLSMITGVFPGGEFVLPAIYMPDVVTQIESQRKKALRRRQKPPSKKHTIKNK